MAFIKERNPSAEFAELATSYRPKPRIRLPLGPTPEQNKNSTSDSLSAAGADILREGLEKAESEVVALSEAAIREAVHKREHEAKGLGQQADKESQAAEALEIRRRQDEAVAKARAAEEQRRVAEAQAKADALEAKRRQDEEAAKKRAAEERGDASALEVKAEIERRKAVQVPGPGRDRLSNRKNENAIHHVDYSEHRHDRLQEAAAQVRPTRQLGTEGGLHADSGRDGDDPYIRLASVSGKSRELLFFLYKKTLNSRERCITDELSVYDLSDGFSAGESSPKQTHDNLRTLKENQVIFLQESKRGRGGWSRYRINRHIFEQIITMERPLHVQNARATRPVLEAAHATANPSLSSKEAFEADSAWRSISIDEARAFAFSETHLWQLYDGQIHENEKSSGRLPLTAEQVQNSIDAWVHARKSGKSDAGITVFMGVVRNRKEWLPVEGFRSRKTIEAEVRAKVAAEEVEALRRAEEAERQLAFLKWKNGLSTEVQRQLVEKHCSWGKPNPGTRIWEEALMREYEGGVGEDVRAEV